MLREMTSSEVSEWQAYFKAKEKIEEDREIAEDAKERARSNNR